MNDKIWNQASRFLAGEMQEAEVQEWRNWLMQAPENQHWFEEVEKAWSLSKEGSKSWGFDSKRGWIAVREHIQMGSVRPIQSFKTQKTAYPWLRIAAGIALLCTVGISLFVSGVFGRQEVLLTTTSSEEKAVILAEGTEVQLNGDTRFRYPESFTGKNRTVFLDEGEAFFEVARDASHPFIVKTGAASVRVLGTAFNIRNEGELIVSVSHGKVQVQADGNGNEALILIKGEEARYDPATGTLKKDSMDINTLAWKTDSLLFRNTPLIEVVSDISRYFHTEIRLENSELAPLRLTSTFVEEPLGVVLEMLELQYGLTIEKKEGVYLLK